MNEKITSEWSEVGDHLGSLGLKLKFHAEQAVSADRERIDDALHNVFDTIEEAFDALRGAVTDPAIHEDVKMVAGSLAQAVSATLGGVGREIRDRTKSRGSGPVESESPPSTPPST